VVWQDHGTIFENGEELMSKRLWQTVLLIGAIVSLIVVVVVLLQVILSPYVHGGPARVVHVNAGPYPIQVTFYDSPANAGYALPFAIQPDVGEAHVLTYDVSAVPANGTRGSVVHANVSANMITADGIPGYVNITVRGSWELRILVNGPKGQGQVTVPFEASAPPAIPGWFAWSIGFIPLCGLVIFLLAQWRRHQKQSVVVSQGGF
jgi:hypothetical protein